MFSLYAKQVDLLLERENLAATPKNNKNEYQKVLTTFIHFSLKYVRKFKV